MLETLDGNVVRRFYTNSAFVLHGFAKYEEALAIALDGIDAERRAGTNPHGQMCIYENAAELMCILGRPREAADLLGDEVGAYSSDTALMHATRGLIALQLGDPSGSPGRGGEGHRPARPCRRAAARGRPDVGGRRAVERRRRRGARRLQAR